MRQLHLLRPFARWQWRGVRIHTVDEAEIYVKHIAGLGFGHFYTGTARLPKRHEELKGGSVFFVKAGEALFRMPFLRVEDEPDIAAKFQGRWLIVMEPKLIRVAAYPKVGFCRGWRYAEADQVPGDADEWEDERKVLSEHGMELREMGFV